MSRKTLRIAQIIQKFQGRDQDAHYLGYFECFNQQLFYEAHDVLEELWLGQRKASNGAFYKGLIQLAGAFVHLQKNRLRPAAALLKLSRASLQSYPSIHESLDLQNTRALIEQWLDQLESADFSVNPLASGAVPELHLNSI